MSSLRGFRSRAAAIPQTAPLDDRQVENSAGGFVFEVTPLERIKRFLILGSEATAYASGDKLTKDNAQGLMAYVAAASGKEQIELIDLIVEVSTAGRAPKQQPALFALALVIAETEHDIVKNYGYHQVNAVCRTASTLFEFFSFLNQFQRFGMGARKAIARWYASRGTDSLAYQMAKYRNRAGFTHADLLRLSKRVKSSQHENPRESALLSWAVGKPYIETDLPPLVLGLEKAKDAKSASDFVTLIERYGLSWEMLPSEALALPSTWKALLDKGSLPYTALLRNAGRLSRLLDFDEKRIRLIAARLSDAEEIKKSRMHPMNILIALKTYQTGSSLRGSDSWTVQPRIAQAMEDAFYLAFGNVEPTGKRMLIALDVSGSMTWTNVAGLPMTAAEAVAALSLVTLEVEDEARVVGFDTSVRPLPLRPGMKLSEAMYATSSASFGGTDAAAAIRYARENQLRVDSFVVMTDNETWAGPSHATVELQRYRNETGLDAKLIVVATSATGFTIADPADPGQLDIAGFDTATPQVISAFSRGL